MRLLSMKPCGIHAADGDPEKVYHTRRSTATKGRIYIRVHRLSASLSCIFVQLNLAFGARVRYTLQQNTQRFPKEEYKREYDCKTEQGVYEYGTQGLL